MIRIEPTDWFTDRYAKVKSLVDILRVPKQIHAVPSAKELDKIRQTQIEHDEIVRILGIHEEFSLVMKFDRVIGWVPSECLQDLIGVKDFIVPRYPPIEAIKFLKSWQGTPYLWGGVTKMGVDCSGFTQRYFLEVHGIIIPKNSKDQRAFGKPKSISEIRDDDLIFCHRKNGEATHHVALFYNAEVWHARLVEGVVCQSWAKFLDLYEVEATASILF